MRGWNFWLPKVASMFIFHMEETQNLPIIEFLDWRVILPWAVMKTDDQITSSPVSKISPSDESSRRVNRRSLKVTLFTPSRGGHHWLRREMLTSLHFFTSYLINSSLFRVLMTTGNEKGGWSVELAALLSPNWLTWQSAGKAEILLKKCLSHFLSVLRRCGATWSSVRTIFLPKPFYSIW